MRIAYVAERPLPSQTADSLQVMKMCQAFGRAGHELTLIAPAAGAGAADPFGYYGVEPCFRIQRLPPTPGPGSSYWYGLLAGIAARRQGAELVYGRSCRACWVAARLGVPARFEAHMLLARAGPGTRWVFSRLLRERRFAGMVVISEALGHAYRRHYGLPEERVLLARDAADPPGSAEPLGFADSERLQVGYVGQLYPGKGMELLAPLAERCPWADFHVVGGEPPDLERWRRLCADRPNLLFHGFVPPAETDRYRISCQVLLAPYQRRVWAAGGDLDIAPWMSPLKLFEYMAAGRPILCSDLPVLREVLVDGESGLLCPPDDVEAWARALTRLRDDAGLRARLGEAAGRSFLRHHTWAARAERVLQGLPTC